MTDLSNSARLRLDSALQQTDQDPIETKEWLEALDGVAQCVGPERVQFLMERLAKRAASLGIAVTQPATTPYQNTISVAEQPPYPGDSALEERLSAALRWNALAMVVRANKAYGELGGHIASYASAADLFEVGFNHFFRAADAQGGGDLVYFQPHSAPGVYARAYLEGFLSEQNLEHYRREIGGPGLCSYPHPWLMPDFWQFPTGSMGIGPINAIYQARFIRYLQNRSIIPTADKKVWGFFGDGEMDEPEAIGALSLAAREHLDNLVFVINCNLQRLDGPVRGNGRIVDELEALFRGAGWNVIKVLWGSDWDALFARDANGTLLNAFSRTVDGQFQTFSANNGAYNREHFFGQSPELQALAAHLSDDEINQLRRGGHDPRKLHAAYARAMAHTGQPTVILAKTMKGFGMGAAGQGRMTTHQQKKLEIDDLKAFRTRFALPLSDDDVADLKFYRPSPDSAEMRYMHARRTALGGYLPRRRRAASRAPALPAISSYGKFAFELDGREMSTTLALVRMMTTLLKDKAIGPRVVPIVADEARTFGMANMFRQVGIYSPHGQLYEPEDLGSMLYYRETSTGQILEEGISEAGAVSSWIAAATAYSVHDTVMLPFYIYYSMFGFQRIGDLIWAAADQRARGFLVGATSGKTTLGGEGLQHQDGSSHLAASTIPNCRAYDPAFAYEVATIVDAGMREMVEDQRDVFYYVTVTNENYGQPSVPEVDPLQLRNGIVKGMYALPRQASAPPLVQLLGSGAILREVIAAAACLEADWQIPVSVWSVTSFTELHRDGIVAERTSRLGTLTQSYVSQSLGTDASVVVAATDYVRAVPELVRGFVPGKYVTLGTDGFGRSDTRQALREFFEVDRDSIVIAALHALCEIGQLDAAVVREALTRYNKVAAGPAPWTI
ncbi:alpha-ketoglutarate dehydrogenase [Burkholderia cenocepacia]|jgi:pyruvate dehydrogenase E1 component|uniref:alpha-ketoglutarate dehydrogenase n=1 Tax=Burkholderia cenocepacia TaxID=95486 RepID=UPI0004F6F275|nr:alpha-ketoglutarate dehydrogenase [Burkholderia cenocepacia]AIO43274.1 pyruvate dehydrogenase (acetyl-transferring), homodimeric type [Burkholderia cepacia]KGC04726.1 pyruvate dehydrogenase (acetyl-transferring), homodimeric type [Burkholderia cepacia]MCG0576797.1 alpha-ketoglutarate dehydrogenase [Burkholderia cenocepacia]MCW3527497.1 alpha-ketoglutarate dehydrogenase [Burkholderia cenocepacia]MCW3617531.1 alpha-ketoglutarate dehydrogenase [Burkholderia cenocepacia]